MLISLALEDILSPQRTVCTHVLSLSAALRVVGPLYGEGYQEKLEKSSRGCGTQDAREVNVLKGKRGTSLAAQVG